MTPLKKRHKSLILSILLLMLSFVLIACEFIIEGPTYQTDDVLEAIEITYAEDEDHSQVTQDIILINQLDAYPLATITWESSHPNIITASGLVTRPEEDTTVFLIVNVRVGSVSKQKIFEVTVKGTSTDDADQMVIDNVIDTIDIIYQGDDYKDSVTTDVVLTTEDSTYPSVEMTWVSSHPLIISNEGVVTRPLHDAVVRLTVTVLLNNITEEKIFDVTVKGTLIQSTYTVVIYYEAVAEATYELISTEDISSFVGDEITLNEILVDGFVLNQELSVLSGTVEDEGLTLTYYYDRVVYRVEYYESDVLIGYEEVKFGGTLTEIPVVSKEGYEFNGWSTSVDGPAFDINKPIDAAYTLYPLWRTPTVYLPYYSDLTDATGATLLAELNAILNRGVTMQTYGDARYILQESDVDPQNSNNIILVYRGTSVNATWDSGITWNREHVWPQSYLGVSTNNSSRHVGADLHNLKPANPSENSSRGNKYFAWTTTADAYEPRDEVKGDVARILFYMVAMYDYLELINSTPSTYQMAMLDILLEWHEQDPVDDFERYRNEVIYTYQNNRNPFIDHPELVDLIWNDNTTVQSHTHYMINVSTHPMVIESKKPLMLI
jgi:endonuclease I